MKKLTLFLALFAIAPAALADAPPPPPHKVVLRLSTVAPDGTSWARELRAFGRELSDATNGEVTTKWFFGGIAGSDTESLERVKRDQLDGIGSGGVGCSKLSPSFAALHLPGLYRGREEVRYVAGQLRGLFEEEFHKAGLVYLGHAVLGPNLLFSRRPLRSFADVKREKLWVWDTDEATARSLTEVGLNLHPASIENGGTLYAEGRIDGFVAMPVAMLAFQWSTQAKYVTDLPTNYLVSCVMLTEKVFDKLTPQQQQATRSAVAKLSLRLEEVGEDTDKKLLAGGFGRQGLTAISPSDALKTEWWNSTAAAIDRLGDKLVPATLRKRIAEILQTKRAAHAQ
jgi:TRAP-type C4-dicarboxylate transport system substrate-binding protein